MSSKPEKVFIIIPADFVREGIEYTDKKTGELKTFNVVTIPGGTIVEGEDLGGWEFCPFYVNESKDDFDSKVIPLLANRTVRLSITVMEDGKPKRDESGRRVKLKRELDPHILADAIEEALFGKGFEEEEDIPF